MGIKLDSRAQEAVIERALRDARDPSRAIDEAWAGRVRWLTVEVDSGDSKGSTYIAALGAAMLAKAVDPRVDTLTHRPEAGPRGYSMRPVAERLQKLVRGKVDLGTDSAYPVNNAPFYKGHPQIDRFVVAARLQHTFTEYLDWLRRLDALDAVEAYEAFVAFMRVRMQVQQAEDKARAEGTRMLAASSAAELLEVVQQWLTEDPERGARAQAVAAAVLDLVWTDVEVVPKHNPAPFDVKRTETPPPLVCECKQLPVTEAEVLGLAKRASEHDAELALYVAFAVDQAPLPVARIRIEALRTYGTLLDVAHDVYELVVSVCVHGGIHAAEVAQDLPQALADRCAGAGVTKQGLKRLKDLLASAGAQIRLDDLS